MDFKIWRKLTLLVLLDFLPAIVSGLEANEGETLTLTCPRPAQQQPVVWEGPDRFTHYTRGLQVSIDLSADLRSRIALSGNHRDGFYNLQITDVRKSDSGSYRCKIGSRVIRKIKLSIKTQEEQNQGLFPYILNLATRARIEANATCGEQEPQYFCKLVDNVDRMPQISHCDHCNARAGTGRLEEVGEAHPITNAIDGSNNWWQSPAISNGREFNYVSITLDLGLIYQVAYVVVKAANAPRPGNWILEKSVDGISYEPWQFFAITDEDCERIYNMRATRGKPSYDYLRDDEVRCTSYFSKLNPLENGEIFVSLTNGKPGIFVPSKTLLDFTSARYVRLRFQKIRTLNADLMSLQSRDPRNLDPSVTRRYFYSVKDISIGGQCICYGHATECQKQSNSDRLACVCQHNACGDNCEICCPLYNNKLWLRGGSNGQKGVINKNVECEECNCHGHADACVYNSTVDALRLGMNINGEMIGGGVCIDCKDFTKGINCERCMPGYYRPWGVPHTSRRPCRQCNCQQSVGNSGICVEDDTRMEEGLAPGSCICRPGYGGQNCDQCAPGYHSYPNCEPCSCSLAGTIDPNMCEGRCVCKVNVEGTNCDRCREGYYDLNKDNEAGCRQCFCFGVSTVCQSAGLGLVQISDMRDAMDSWTVITLNDEGFTLFPSAADGWLEYHTFPAREQNALDVDRSSRDEVIYYWQAPVKYYGNRLTSYGGQIHYTMKFTIDDSAPWQNHLAENDIILQGTNLSVTNGRNYIREEQENTKSVTLDETQWFPIDVTGQQISQNHVSRKDFMLLLYDLHRILIRATHHTAQDNVMIKNVYLDTSSAGSTSDISITGVEKCSCPRGYTGLSCESCDIGWRRLDNVLYGGTCVPCNCQGHSKTCDPYTGRCLMCTDNTEGDHCETCRRGYYGDPTRGNPEDCKPCACPLNEVTNNFATKCALSPTFNNPDAFVCLDCAQGYTGERCERCDHGYYGYPGLLGNYCQACDCNGNIDRDMPGSCDQLSGECRVCLHNTEGPHCGTCRLGYYGTAVNGDCKLCNCDPFGSNNMTCDIGTGQCQCKEHYTGRLCDRCEAGYGDTLRGCTVCNCSRVGSLDYRCHPVTGQCVCRPGISGLTCDVCRDGYYGYSQGGCYDCRCYRPGTNTSDICDLDTGACRCLPNTEGAHCDSCKVNYWGLESGQGCTACDCNPQGSYFDQCEGLTGQCRCKQGVTGRSCDMCVEGYYGLASGECRECEPCTLPGHICHPDTGACVCPPNTQGHRCEQCIDTYWGYDPQFGCKPCDCDLDGALDNNCDPLTGQCACKRDYNGTHCDRCPWGYYSFPQCTACTCSIDGTEPSTCTDRGSCSCGRTDGQCLCKENTAGGDCGDCDPGSFSLDRNNPDGCTDCFCFERSSSCGQATYVWSQVAVPEMSVSFNDLATSIVSRQLNGFYVIPDNVSWTRVPENTAGDPIYWRLSTLTGDQTLSYNGVLKFTVEHGSLGITELSNLEGLVDSPLVVLVGHNIPLMYRSEMVWDQDTGLNFEVRLHEQYWRTQRNTEVSRKRMMIILQNVTDILVRATWDNSAISARIGDIKLDRAVDNAAVIGRPALGIEQCNCPSQYTGLSCQDPAAGYYRIPNVGPIDFTDLIGIIGDVKPCECRGHSDICHPHTGVCIGCRDNTAGHHCEICGPGYYGDATIGRSSDCQRCACPLEVSSNNFSPTCERIDTRLVCTACQEGYTGDRCEYCDVGYYGHPSIPGDGCENCNCNHEGSVINQCDNDGRCQCLPGITGDKCDQCQPRYAVVKGTCVSCDEGCTRTLMADLDELHNMTLTLPFDPSNVNITFPFRKLAAIRNETRILSDKLAKLKYEEVNNLQDDLYLLEQQVDDQTDRSETSLEKSIQNKADAEDLLRAADEVEDTIKLLQQDIEELVTELEDNVAASFHNRSGVNVTASLDEARRILDEIRARDFADAESQARREIDLAEELSDRVKVEHLRVNNISSVEAKIDQVLDALNDLLLVQEHKSIENSETTMKKIALLKDALKNIKQHVNATSSMSEMSTEDISMADILLEDARDALNRTRENVLTLETRVSTLDAAMVPLKEKEENLRTKLPPLEPLVERAIAHANNLSKYAEELEKMFESTRSAAEDPLRAARVYEDIVRAIDEAEKAARKAIDDADNATSITDLDDLRKRVDDALKRSRELKKQADDLDNGLKPIEDDLGSVNNVLNRVEQSQDDTVDKNTEIQTELGALPQDTVDRISNVKTSVDKTDTTAKRVNDKSKTMVDKVNKEMMPKLRELQNLHADKYEDVYLTLSGTQTDLGDMKNVTDSIDRKIEESRRLRSDIGDKLNQLKQSIREAREEANKVKTSLMSDGKCARKYRSSTQPGTLNTISFAFKTPEPNSNMLFALVQNPEITEGDVEKEFLAVELRNGRVRFSWNAGGGVGFVEDTTVIQSETSIIKETDKWYKVIAQRIGRLGRLTVHKIAETPPAAKTKASVIGYSVMSLNERTDVYVSGIPDGYPRPADVTNLNFTGCMGGVNIDEQLLGLSNFETSTGDTCMACLEVPAESSGGNIYTFDGTGYAVMDKVRIDNPILGNIILDFSTWWENASLFFVGNETTGEFLSLELVNGFVVFQYYLGEDTYGSIKTDARYNRNGWVSVAIGRNGYYGLMEVDNNPAVLVQAPKGDYLLDVKDADLYFGGIPPTVNMAKYRDASKHNVTTNKFLGCMKGIQIKYDNLNLWNGKTTVGVTEGCKDSGLRSVGFYGQGFAEFIGMSWGGVEADVSLSFTTEQDEALLLLAKDINGDQFYSLSLINGRIEGRFSGGGNPVTLTTKEKYNDGMLHNVAVKKTNRRLDMYLDDKVVDNGRLPSNQNLITVREDGGLYLGGIPNSFVITGLAPTEQYFDGCISDVVVNGVVVNINKPKQYDKADIGRCSHNFNSGVSTDDNIPGPFASDAPAEIREPNDKDKNSPSVKPTKESMPKPGTTKDSMKDNVADKMTSDMAGSPGPVTLSPMSCASNNGFNELEDDAYTFGEEKTSYHQINVTKKDILRNFEITFDTRTFYQDGILLYLSNLDHSSFLAVSLKDGKAVITFDRGGKIKELKVKPKSSLTNGEWHNILVKKSGQRITLLVDGNSKRRVKISKVLKVDVPLFVGGVPAKFVPLLNKKVVKHGVRGCMRNLVVNNKLQTFSDTGMMKGVNRCFSKVEAGAHFTGNSYALYDSTFGVDGELSVDLEFRTSTPEGILVTMTNGADGASKRALTLELHEGQVSMGIVGGSKQTTLMSQFSSQFYLCDGEWHKVKVTINQFGVMTLQVDGQEPVAESLDDDVRTISDSPLYIGGKPQFSDQPAASSSLGFEGCLKNVKIQDTLVDWFDLEGSVGVHKTACPLS